MSSPRKSHKRTPSRTPSRATDDNRVGSYSIPKEQFWYLDSVAPENYIKATLGQVCLMISLQYEQYVNEDVRKVYVLGQISPRVFPGESAQDVLRRLFLNLPSDNTVVDAFTHLINRRPQKMALASDSLLLHYGFIHKFSTRPSATKSLIIQLWGTDQAIPCICCEKRWAKSISSHRRIKTNWPYYDCRVLDGYFGNKCGNCMYHEQNATACSYYTKNFDNINDMLIMQPASTITVPEASLFKPSTSGAVTPVKTPGDILTILETQKRGVDAGQQSSIEQWIRQRENKVI